MNNICIWNIRGLNSPKKQKEVARVMQLNNVALCGLIETIIRTKSFASIVQNLFKDWSISTNFTHH